MLGLTFQAQAADWNFYGSARLATFYKDVDTNNTSTGNYEQNLHSNARIGARVKAGDELFGRFEYGSSGGNANIRHLFGEWNFGPGKFLVGQTDTPLNFALSKQVINSDHNLNAYGHVDGKRKPMIQLTFGDFVIAAVRPESSDLNLASSVIESKIPKIEATYTFNMDKGFIEFGGGYQNYELTDTGTSREYDVTSYVLVLGGQVKFGAAYLNADVWAGQNVGPYDFNFAADGDPVISGGSMVDNDAVGFMLAAGYKLNNTLAFEAGYGQVQSDLDQGAISKDKAESYYIQSTITLAPGVIIVPEIGRIDGKTNHAGVRENDTVYAGAKWQIDF